MEPAQTITSPFLPISQNHRARLLYKNLKTAESVYYNFGFRGTLLQVLLFQTATVIQQVGTNTGCGHFAVISSLNS